MMLPRPRIPLFPIIVCTVAACGDSRAPTDTPDTVAPTIVERIVERETIASGSVSGVVLSFPNGLHGEPYALDIPITDDAQRMLLIGASTDDLGARPLVTFDITGPDGTPFVIRGTPTAVAHEQMAIIPLDDPAALLLPTAGWTLVGTDDRAIAFRIVDPMPGTWSVTIVAAAPDTPFAVAALTAPVVVRDDERAAHPLVRADRLDAPWPCTVCGGLATLVAAAIPIEELIAATGVLTDIANILRGILVALGVELRLAGEAATLAAGAIGSKGAELSVGILDEIITDAACVHVFHVCAEDYVHDHVLEDLRQPDHCAYEGEGRCTDGLQWYCSRVGSPPYDHLEWIACEGCMCRTPDATPPPVNHPPYAVTSPRSAELAVGEEVLLWVSCTDPDDGDRCVRTWCFDGDAHPYEGPAITLAWSTPGRYTLRCVGVDTYGLESAPAYATFDVRTPPEERVDPPAEDAGDARTSLPIPEEPASPPSDAPADTPQEPEEGVPANDDPPTAPPSDAPPPEAPPPASEPNPPPAAAPSSAACTIEASVQQCWGCPTNPVVFNQSTALGGVVTVEIPGGPDIGPDYRTACDARGPNYGWRNYRPVITRIPLSDGRTRIIVDMGGGTGWFPGSEGYVQLHGACRIAEIIQEPGSWGIATSWEGQPIYGNGVAVDLTHGRITWSGRGGCPACACLENGIRMEFIVE